MLQRTLIPSPRALRYDQLMQLLAQQVPLLEAVQKVGISREDLVDLQRFRLMAAKLEATVRYRAWKFCIILFECRFSLLTTSLLMDFRTSGIFKNCDGVLQSSPIKETSQTTGDLPSAR